MFKFDTVFNIVFYAIAAVFVALFLAGFIVSIARDIHVRETREMVIHAFDFVFLIVALVVCAVVLLVSYDIFGLRILNIGGKFALTYSSKSLFEIARVGFIADNISALGVGGVILSLAALGMNIICLACFGVKSKRRWRVRRVPKNIDPSFFPKQNLLDFCDEDNSGESPELCGEKVERSEKLTAKNILSEIDELVPTPSEKVKIADSGIQSKLERAIKEGLALDEQYRAKIASVSEQKITEEKPEVSEQKITEEKPEVSEIKQVSDNIIQGGVATRVVTKSGNLPAYRRVVILNRNSAVDAFAEFIQDKRAAERGDQEK